MTLEQWLIRKIELKEQQLRIAKKELTALKQGLAVLSAKTERGKDGTE